MAISKELKCKTCGKAIRFIDTEKNKKMPVNAKLLTVEEMGVNSINVRVVNRSGKLGLLIDLKEGFAPHFITCLNYKKKKAGEK
jgi:hypothetical protein